MLSDAGGGTCSQIWSLPHNTRDEAVHQMAEYFPQLEFPERESAVIAKSSKKGK